MALIGSKAVPVAARLSISHRRAEIAGSDREADFYSTMMAAGQML
jgi:hypothetical protein